MSSPFQITIGDIHVHVDGISLHPSLSLSVFLSLSSLSLSLSLYLSLPPLPIPPPPPPPRHSLAYLRSTWSVPVAPCTSARVSTLASHCGTSWCTCPPTETSGEAKGPTFPFSRAWTLGTTRVLPWETNQPPPWLVTRD